MCGLTGFICFSQMIQEPERTLNQMAAAIAHRGPDDKDIWIDKEEGIGMAHQRLSIIDLSADGRQPMVSYSKRYYIVFNGEIYNYREIRKEIDKEKNIKWCGQSDTEVMLNAIEIWGIERALEQFNGMFAFALWDSQDKRFFLVRDRLGIKPMYYAQTKNAIVFGSELKAIKLFPEHSKIIDHDALTLYLKYNCIPAPYSVYKKTWKLMPGQMLEIDCINYPKTRKLVPKYYWNSVDTALNGQRQLFEGSMNDAVQTLEALLLDSVKKRMVADVPLGAFLSGGIDSSTIVAMMQAQSETPVKTFTIGTHSKGYDEAAYAKNIASHLGTDHTELYISPTDATDVIPNVTHLFDEPFSDPSMIPTFLVSQLSKQYVTVSLSGDGGDELFGGYHRHYWVPVISKRMKKIPLFLRKAAAQTIQQISPLKWDAVFYNLNRVMPQNKQFSTVGDNLHKLAGVLPESSCLGMYHRLCSHWDFPENVVVNGMIPNHFDGNKMMSALDSSHLMMYADLVTYLPDDILTKVDRTTMGVGLEGRVPFLDHRVVSFAWRLPLSYKIRRNKGKLILRQILKKYIPESLFERPKMGFGIPIDAWLRGPLKDWAESLICEDRLKEDGVFNIGPIRRKWREHLSGKFNWQYLLWDILMFQAWLEKNKG